MSGYQNDDDLDDIYSDLSANQQIVPTQTTPKTQTVNKPVGGLIKMPAFMGGKAFMPPPPPPSSNPSSSSYNDRPTAPLLLGSQQHQQQPRQQHQNQNKQSYTSNNIHNNTNTNTNPHNNHNNNRQRKNTVFVSNLPKMYNRQQTLTTFFRNYGNIKSIKCNQLTHSAQVRFEKQADAYRFMHTHPLIYNRSYIIYGINQDIQLTPAQIQQRQQDQIGPTVNNGQKQVIIMKQNAESILSDKYRALLFLSKHKHLLSIEKCEQIDLQMASCRKIKQSESTNEQLGELLANLQNDYDWTLIYKVITKQTIDKKKIITQFNKHGPISTINIKLSALTGQTEQPASQNQDRLAVIRIRFLGVRSSWEMFMQNQQSLNLEVEGSKLRDTFTSWFVTKQQEKSQEQNHQENIQNSILPADQNADQKGTVSNERPQEYKAKETVDQKMEEESQK